MRVLIVEPYDTGSHARWARGYQRFSQHEVSILGLPGQFWQWRMLGSAVPLAEQFKVLPSLPDVILASDMLDLTTFLALTRPQSSSTPTAVYFHENQLTYPTGPRQKLANHYAFINYTSALVADAVFFNSEFHQEAFFEELPRLLKHFPDYNGLHTIAPLQEKAMVLPVGLDLAHYDAYQMEKDSQSQSPLILWNHRWEHDKNPLPFFKALYRLADEGYDFMVALTGENFRQKPSEFEKARHRLGKRVIQYGYLERFEDYARLLWRADVVVSTARQDFFGISVVEGIYCGCWPVLARRLNYPSLLPEALHKQTLFTDDNGLYYHLRDYLKNPNPTPPALRQQVAQFDWRVLATHYDQTLAKLADR